MSMEKGPKLPEIGRIIQTTCGTDEKYILNTPRVLHEGKWLFFCIPACQQEFVQDPANSSCISVHSTSEEI